MISALFKQGIGWLKIHRLRRFKPTRAFTKTLCSSKQNNPIGISQPKTDDSKSEFKVETNVQEEKSLENKRENNTLPEEPTTCCMSGCANCVWLDYAEKMSEYFKDGGEKAIKEINERVSDPNIKAFLMQELRMRKL